MQKFALALWASLPADYLGRCIIIEVHDERFAELVVEAMICCSRSNKSRRGYCPSSTDNTVHLSIRT